MVKLFGREIGREIGCEDGCKDGCEGVCEDGCEDGREVAYYLNLDMKTIVVMFQIIAYIIFQLAGRPGLGGAGGWRR